MLATTEISRNPKGQPFGLLTEMSNASDLCKGQDMTEWSWDVMLTLSVNPGDEVPLNQYSGEHIYHLPLCPAFRLVETPVCLRAR